MSTINGLPAHVLLVHAAVIFVPACALLVIAVVCWPAARHKLSLPAAVFAVLTAVLVQLTADAGEWLEHRIGRSPLIHAHTQLGDDMLPWSLGVAGLAVAWWALFGRPTTTGTVRKVAMVVVGVLTITAAAGSVVQVYRVGESGARAVWSGTG